MNLTVKYDEISIYLTNTLNEQFLYIHMPILNFGNSSNDFHKI